MAVNTNDQKQLLNDMEVVQRIFEHIDNSTTDKGTKSWKEPVDNYRSKERLEGEFKILQKPKCRFLSFERTCQTG